MPLKPIIPTTLRLNYRSPNIQIFCTFVQGFISKMQLQNILLYQVADEKVNVSFYFKDGTFWLTQKAMAALFGVNRTVVTKHLKNIFETLELQENSVCANIAHTAEDGKNYNTKFYRLEAILAVGYRVNYSSFTYFINTKCQIKNM